MVSFSPERVYFISLKFKYICVFHAFSHKKRGKYLLTTISIYILYYTILILYILLVLSHEENLILKLNDSYYITLSKKYNSNLKFQQLF